MKKIFILLIVLISFNANTKAQNIGINATGATPDKSAMLDVSSTTKGMLSPRMTTTQRTSIAAPAKGLLVFDTDNNSFWFYNGSAWTQLSGIGNVWSLSGNSGTNSSTDFIGTTDDNDLHFRIKNINAGIIDSSSSNTAFGFRSMDSMTTAPGQFNTAFGYKSLTNNTSGLYNTAHGAYSLRSNTSGSFNTGAGLEALYSNTIGNYNTGYGPYSLSSNTIGNNNTAIGVYTLSSNTTGNENIGVGNLTLIANTTGNHNTALGYLSLVSSVSGDDNTAIGYLALNSNISGSGNTANGVFTLTSNEPGNGNTASGIFALSINMADSNTAFGGRALITNTNGDKNTAMGTSALSSNTFGENNTAIGFNALKNNVGGYNNIAIGSGSGTAAYAPDTYNTISIGNNGYLNGYQNQAFIGNTSTAWIGGNSTWMTFSDARIKNTITEDVKGLDFILKLRPVTYHISNKLISSITGNKETPDFPGKNDREKIKYSGFLGQEVEQAANSVDYNFSGCVAPKDKRGLYSLSYEQFVVPLVKAVQEQQAIINKQNEELELLKNRLTVLESKMK